MLQNKEIRRGDETDIVFYLDGDYSTDVFSFVVKADKSLTTARQIEKHSSDATELERLYNSTLDRTEITIHILQADTQGLSVSDYYYDLFNDTDNETPIHGRFWILADVQTPTDNGVAPIGLITKGTTAERPTLDDSEEYIGFEYFDTDINSPIWWSGTEWV